MLGHLIHGERIDWLARIRIILEHGEARRFDTFDRRAQRWHAGSGHDALGHGLLGLPPRAGPGGTATIAELLPVIMRSPEVDRAVVDATGLLGTFDFNLSWTPTALAATGGDAVSIFTMLRDNLGLRLEPRNMLRDAVVIESIERPTED